MPCIGSSFTISDPDSGYSGATAGATTSQNLVDEILLILPNIWQQCWCCWLAARYCCRIVTNLLASAGFDQLGRRFGLRGTTGGNHSLVGTSLCPDFLIPVAIAAMPWIDAISVPAIAMLQQILNALPAIFTAALILIAAYFLGRFVSDLVTNIITSLGFNNIFSVLGLPSPSRRPATRATQLEVTTLPTEQTTVIQPAPTAAAGNNEPRQKLSGIIVLVGIMLFATVAAVNILNIPALVVALLWYWGAFWQDWLYLLLVYS